MRNVDHYEVAHYTDGDKISEIVRFEADQYGDALAYVRKHFGRPEGASTTTVYRNKDGHLSDSVRLHKGQDDEAV